MGKVRDSLKKSLLMRLRNISKVEERGKGLLKDIDLRINRGDLITIQLKDPVIRDLLFSVMALIDPPSSGSIILDDSDLSGMKERELTRLRLKNIGMVFRSNYFIDDLSIRKNIELLLKEAGVPKGEIDKSVYEALEAVGIEDRANFRPIDLSQYEIEAADIARALAKGPRLLLINEPSKEVNGRGKSILELIKGINKRFNMTIVITTTEPKLQIEAKRRLRVHKGVLRGP